jgi:deazaflavin-dependent oxidoreductase (nitroreductase family)
MLILWRLGMGRLLAGPRRGYIMVLVTTGRKTGRRRPVPLNFAEDPGSVYCLAGFGKTTHWLINLQADPVCEVWLPDGRRLHGTAAAVTDEARRIEIIRRVLVRAGFATTVAEPGLDPLAATDAEIATLGRRYGHRYEVVQIRLDGAAGGPGGPGDLKWVLGLTVAGGAALASMLGRRCRSS